MKCSDCPFEEKLDSRPKCPLVRNSGGNMQAECGGDRCAWWDSKANYNTETKQYEGQCCILTLSRLKVSGLITTHPG